MKHHHEVAKVALVLKLYSKDFTFLILGLLLVGLGIQVWVLLSRTVWYRKSLAEKKKLKDAKAKEVALQKSISLAKFDPRLVNLEFKDKPSGLNDEQGLAWASKVEKNLTIACAGAGKTRLAVARARMLVDKGVPIQKLLFLTFSREATKVMIERLSGAFGIDETEFRKIRPTVPVPRVTTIHKFSLQMLKAANFEFQLQERDFDWLHNPYRLAWRKVLDPIIESNINGNGHRLLCLLQQRNRKLINTTFDFEKENIHGEGTIDAVGGLKVRSKAEAKIIKWLHEKGIRVEYERPVVWADFPFRPDFFLSDFGFYIEYLGLWTLDKEREKEQVAYRESFFAKQQQFVKYSLSDYLVEIKPDDRISFKEKIESKIKEKLNPKRVYEVEEKSLKTLKKEADVLAKLCNQIRIDMLKNDVAVDLLPLGKFDRETVKLVMALADRIDDSMVDKNTGKAEIDLDMVIVKTARLLNERRELIENHLSEVEYLFLDEFQDVYPALFKLIKPIMDSKKFFAIGDERQAIYGFLGSTPRYIRELPLLIQGTVQHVLNTNYRSTPEIVSFSESVLPPGMTSNKAFRGSGKKVEVWELENEAEQADALLELLNAEEPIKELMVLNRYNAGAKGDATMTAWKEAVEKHGGKYLTFHGSKGLEKDTVIVTGLVESKSRYSFPSRSKDHPVRAAIKRAGGQNDPDAEERRLFYVALSRAERRLVVVTEKGAQSRFLSSVSGHDSRYLCSKQSVEQIRASQGVPKTPSTLLLES